MIIESIYVVDVDRYVDVRDEFIVDDDPVDNDSIDDDPVDVDRLMCCCSLWMIRLLST